MKTLIVGLGNPILGDDAVGWHVARQVEKQLKNQAHDIDVECLAVGGLRLMEFMVGYDYAIVIDALTTLECQVGDVSCLPLEKLPDLTATHITSSHDTSLQTALKLGRNLGYHLPERIMVVGIEAHNPYEFSEQLSPSVESAIPVAVQTVLDALLAKKDNRL